MLTNKIFMRKTKRGNILKVKKTCSLIEVRITKNIADSFLVLDCT